MPRLPKKKLDAIKKVRLEGYTQKETAERVGVDIKTVKAHDPLRSERKEVSLEGRLERLETICKSLAAKHQWLTSEFDMALVALSRLLDEDGRRLGDYLDEPEKSICPKCCGDMVEDEAHYRCLECGFSAPWLEDAL